MAMFWQGLVIGFSIAAPVGPIGVLCIRRTLAEGRVVGLATGLGAASADAVFGCIAGFGLAFISNFLIDQQPLIRLAGGLFLCYLGARTALARPTAVAAQARSGSLLAAYASTFVLTLTNPASIVLFTAIFAGLGLAGGAGDYRSALLLVAGLFLGSALWWTLLSSGVGVLRSRFDAVAMRRVNIGSGIVIAAFGLLSLVSLAV